MCLYHDREEGIVLSITTLPWLHLSSHLRHDENYRDSSVSRRVKNFSFFFQKTMDSYDSLYFFMWVAEKINAKSQKFKKLQLFSS